MPITLDGAAPSKRKQFSIRKIYNVLGKRSSLQEGRAGMDATPGAKETAQARHGSSMPATAPGGTGLPEGSKGLCYQLFKGKWIPDPQLVSITRLH